MRNSILYTNALRYVEGLRGRGEGEGFGMIISANDTGAPTPTLIPTPDFLRHGAFNAVALI